MIRWYAYEFLPPASISPTEYRLLRRDPDGAASAKRDEIVEAAGAHFRRHLLPLLVVVVSGSITYRQAESAGPRLSTLGLFALVIATGVTVSLLLSTIAFARFAVASWRHHAKVAQLARVLDDYDAFSEGLRVRRLVSGTVERLS